jgi:hypothetical protein
MSTTSHWPGTEARNFRIIDDLRWRPISTYTSAIRQLRGSSVPMRTPMVCCGSIFERNQPVSVLADQLNKVARQLNERLRETL